jgi:hypothetical protein
MFALVGGARGTMAITEETCSYPGIPYLRAAALKVHAQHVVGRRDALALCSLRAADGPTQPGHCPAFGRGIALVCSGSGAADVADDTGREAVCTWGPQRQADDQQQPAVQPGAAVQDESHGLLMITYWTYPILDKFSTVRSPFVDSGRNGKPSRQGPWKALECP